MCLTLLQKFVYLFVLYHQAENVPKFKCD